MSLSKQLLILISTLFVLIFGVNLGLSITNTKNYLENESRSHAQDTATSLGLSLSPYMKEPNDPTIKAMISAIFDMGYYGEIRLMDANGKTLIALANNKIAEGVPTWFINFLPMSPAIASSEISTGWTLSGTINVAINPAYAYSSLYQQAKASLYYSLLALVISMLLLSLLLHVTLASLKRINHLAQQIADGHFETIKKLPCTSEVKNVAISMNIMSQKIKGAITALNNKLEITAEKLLHDELSGLYKKSVFETDVAHVVLDHSSAYLQLIKVDSLPELVKEQGSDTIDQLLQKFAGLIKKQAEQNSQISIKAYRFFGGEFAMLIETDDLDQVESICKNLSSDIAELGNQFKKPDLAHIGVSPVKTVDTPESTLIAAQEAYEQARLIGANGYYIRIDHEFARDIAAWKTLVFNSIDNTDYSISYTAQTHDCENNELIMEEASTQAYDQQGNPVAIAPFISIAEKYAKIIDLDKGVIQRVLEHIRDSKIQHAIAINLSTRTIKNAEFLAWLQTLTKTDPIVSKQLVFSFSAYAVSKDLNAYVSFFYTIHKLGGRVMIKRFEPQTLQSEIYKNLRPDFIRLARDVTAQITASQQKQDFTRTMCELSKLLDIKLIAENVQADDDIHLLKNIGIRLASR